MTGQSKCQAIRPRRPRARGTATLALAAVTGMPLAAPALGDPPVTAPLLAQGEIPSGSPAGRHVSAICGVRAVASNAYAAMVELSFGLGDPNPMDAVWGLPAGGVEGVLVHELVHEPFDPNPPLYEQVRFEDAFGFNAQGRVVYSALVPVGLCSPLRRGAGYLDSVWMDRALLAIDGSPVPGDPAMRQLFASRPGVTSDGRAFWHGGASPHGSLHPQDVLPQWEALFIETTAGPVIPWVSSGLPVSGKVLKSIGPFSVSHAGGYAICIGRLDDGSEALIRAGWDEEEGGRSSSRCDSAARLWPRAARSARWGLRPESSGSGSSMWVPARVPACRRTGSLWPRSGRHRSRGTPL